MRRMTLLFQSSLLKDLPFIPRFPGRTRLPAEWFIQPWLYRQVKTMAHSIIISSLESLCSFHRVSQLQGSVLGGIQTVYESSWAVVLMALSPDLLGSNDTVRPQLQINK